MTNRPHTYEAEGAQVHALDEDDQATYVVTRNGTPYGRHDSIEAAEAEAHALADEIRATRADKQAQGPASRSASEEAEQARARQVSRAAEVSDRHPEADPVEYVQGHFRWQGHKYLDHLAVEAEIVARKRRDDRFHAYRAAVEEAITEWGATVRLSRSDDVDKHLNHRTPWVDQYVDVLVPPTHPAFPTRGRIEVVDGLAVIDTLERHRLADRLAVPYPDTIDEKLERRRALDDVRELSQQRAEQAATEARRAADEAEALTRK